MGKCARRPCTSVTSGLPEGEADWVGKESNVRFRYRRPTIAHRRPRLEQRNTGKWRAIIRLAWALGWARTCLELF